MYILNLYFNHTVQLRIFLKGILESVQIGHYVYIKAGYSTVLDLLLSTFPPIIN